MHARIVNVGGIFLVNRHRVRAEDLALHHFGKSEDRIQRRSQLVAHLRQKPRLRDVGRFGAMPRLVGDRFRLLEFADQRVLFGARLQRRQRRRMQAMGEQREIALRRRARALRARNCRTCRSARNSARSPPSPERSPPSAAIGRLAASMLDTAITSSIRNIISVLETTSRPGGMDQDRGPAQAVKQIEQDKPRSPLAGQRERGRLGEEPAAIADDGGMDAEHAAGPGRGRHRLHPEAEQQAGRHHQQHHDIGRRDPRLGILPEQFAVEGRAGSAGRR